MAENSRMKKLPIAVLAAPALAFGSLTFATAPALAENLQPSDQQTSTENPVGPAESSTPIGDAERTSEPTSPPVDGETGDGDGPDSEVLSTETESPDANSPDGTSSPTIANNSKVEEAASVNAAGPTIIVESELDDILPGDMVDIDGSGFSPDSRVVLTINEVELEILAEEVILTDEDGKFAASALLPVDLEAGTYQVVATGSADGEEATFEITVLDWADLLAPELSVNLSEARVGDTVQFTIDNVDELLEEYGSESELLVEGYVADAEGTVNDFKSAGISAVENSTGVFEFRIPSNIETDKGALAIGPGTQLYFDAGIIVTLSEGEEIGLYSDPVAVDILGDEVVINPELTVSTSEITLEDFVGDPREGAGVLHELTGFEPGTEIEYSVATPEGIEPFSQSGAIGDTGEAAFTIYGEDSGDTSVYLGDYTTTVSFVDDNGETQELTASFSVVPGDTGVAPVIDTKSTGEAPAVGASADNLAKTGANGTQLALLAGGLLVLGGAALAFANRRLRSRKN